VFAGYIDPPKQYIKKLQQIKFCMWKKISTPISKLIIEKEKLVPQNQNHPFSSLVSINYIKE